MKETIKVYTDYSERRHCHYYEYATIKDSLQELEFNSIEEIIEEAKKPHYGILFGDTAFKIEEVSPDCENSDAVFDYQYYRIYSFDYERYLDDQEDPDLGILDLDSYTSDELIAVPYPEEDEEEEDEDDDEF